MTRPEAGEYLLWGSELSPYALKLEALLRIAGLRYRWLPSQGRLWQILWCQRRIGRGVKQRSIQRFGGMSTLDEYPLVPFLVAPDHTIYYDSSAIARWLDAESLQTGPPLFPRDPAIGFVAQLLDEAFDEFGLYMVHHMRWVGSAASNNAGERLAGEFRHVLPPWFRSTVARQFSRRQVRRLPYLFSVAAPGLSQDVDAALRAPVREGWPATHQLLENCWCETLAAMESLLAVQPWLLGERFTVADAALYGQLAINMDDQGACERMQRLAPLTYAWLRRIREGAHAGDAGDVRLTPALQPLLQLVMGTFVPLMQQNYRAWQRAVARGCLRFNEAAFDAGEALYDGELCGRPFRSVVKTFQVQVWRDLCASWDGLDEAGRATLKPWLPDWQQLRLPDGGD